MMNGQFPFIILHASFIIGVKHVPSKTGPLHPRG